MVVVGAGIVGLACGWRCAQRGLSVLVVERDLAGAGSSGVAAGMLAPVTEAEFGEEALLGLNLAGAALWPDFHGELAASSGVDVGYRESGALIVAADRDDGEELRRLHAFQVSLGLEVDWLTGRECRRLEPGLSPRVAGGIHARQDHQVDPAAAVRALAHALRAAGGKLEEGVGDVELELDADAVVGVRSERLGSVRADHVVVAAGAWSALLAGLPEESRPPVRPVKGQILSLRGAPGASPVAERLVRTPRCYVVPRGDGSVTIGATMEERGFETRVTGEGVHRLLEAAWEVLPDVGELEFVEARARLRPGTPDNSPLIGPAALDGLVWATGHHRNGVLLAPITAEAVAAIVSGDEPSDTVAAFAPDRFARRPLAEPAR